MLLHEGHGFLGHAVFDVLIRHVGVRIKIRKLPRRDVTARRTRPRIMRHIDIETLLQRRVRFRPEMPLAKMPCGIAHLMQRLRQRTVFGLQPCWRIRLHHLLIRRPLLAHRCLQHDLRHVAIGHSDARARRTQSGEQRGTRGRAQRTRCIRPRESHAALCQSLNIRRLVKLRRAVERRVTPPEIIGENDDHIGPVCGGTEATQKRQEEEDFFHQRYRVQAYWFFFFDCSDPGASWFTWPGTTASRRNSASRARMAATRSGSTSSRFFFSPMSLARL